MKIGILTSGGDAPGMNAAIRAVVRTALNKGYVVYGIKNGYKGLIENDMSILIHDDVSGMLTKGGTFLGTARLEEFADPVIQERGYRVLKKRDIDALVVIGGDGTYRGGLALSKLGIKVVAVPATIDNDLGGTDFTIGFATALETITEAIDKLRDTSSSHQRCSIIEVMGRRCGDLAIYAGVCGGAEFIITPNHMIDKQNLKNTLAKWQVEGRRHAIIVVTEKLFDVHALAKEITHETGFDTRSTVLGYVQRGGYPVPNDRILASRLGAYAIDLIAEHKTGIAVGTRAGKLSYTSIEEAIETKEENKDLFELLDKVS